MTYRPTEAANVTESPAESKTADRLFGVVSVQREWKASDRMKRAGRALAALNWSPLTLRPSKRSVM
jgi:hypothetical protein